MKSFFCLFTLLYIGQANDLLSQTLTWERSIPLSSMQQVIGIARANNGIMYMAGRQGNFLSLLKVNSLGDTIFVRNYSLPGLGSGSLPTGIHYDEDRAKLVIIGTGNPSGGVLNGYVVFLDTNGIIESFQLYNQTTYGGIDAFYELPDKGFLLTGARNFFSGGDIDIFFIRTDSVGNIIKDTSFVKAMPQQAFSIEPLYDGSYLIGGVTGTAQGPAAYALQVDLWGRVIRDTVIQTPTSPFNNQNVRFRQLADDNWSITGSVGTSTPFVYRVGPQFQPQSATYSTNAVSNNRYVSYPTIDSGFLYVGSGGTNNVYLRKFGKTNNVQWTYSFFTSPARIRLFNDLMIGSTGEILGGGAIRDTIGAATDYYWAKLSSSEQPFLKNLCRNLPQVSMSSMLDSLNQNYRVYNTSSSGLQHNPLMRWSWYLPLLNQTVTDSVLVLPTTISSPFPVELTVSHYYGCTATLSANVFSVLGSTPTNLTEGKFKLYPNPAKGAVHLQNARSGRYEIHDLQGRTLQTGILTAEPQQMIDLSSLKPGMYLIRLSDARESSTHKLVVE